MSLPLAELHMHIEGSLEPGQIFEFAERNDIRLPYADIDELRGLYEFTDLQSFLDLYYANTSVLRTAEDFADLGRAYFARAKVAGITHAEVFFDPQAHTSRGVALEAVVEGLADAAASSEREFGVTSGLIASILRDKPVLHANKLLEDLLAMKAPIIGLGLDSAEMGFPPSLFVDVFARARAEGLHVVAHAGEEGPAEYIWQALDLLGAERIDHGVRCLEDEALVNRLVEDEIPLTVCPFSNVRLKVVDTLADHPIRQMIERGLVVTVNSDDPAYFGGYVDDNFAALTDQVGLTEREREILYDNSIRASFS
ncbi:adenosine deaminase [Rhodococcus sp. PAMC28707]|uniref:adenosine deaminase n=1 Tax=unclassified Rhodococcus (in: high G+C Gram-positive bacteria) TaxID=192944 RepID=UPI00109D865D|nr:MULTISPECIES: adenosine deaminase [unclassified Rhodococcus (in: high G+C Gram-positive bacteria)]QCB52180.1 adenosine deaminase [Rhodococcus sp. PAMC28705]QCB59650.1 adenosine deaminase [Rhodococcus sp. PAMC28707]